MLHGLLSCWIHRALLHQRGDGHGGMLLASIREGKGALMDKPWSPTTRRAANFNPSPSYSSQTYNPIYSPGFAIYRANAAATLVGDAPLIHNT